MNLRLAFTIVLFLIAPAVFTKTAFADAVTTNYAESGRDQMKWEFHCNTLAGCTGIPAGLQTNWNSAVAPDIIMVPSTLFVASRHLIGPHFLDVNPGATVTIPVTFNVLNALVINPANPIFTVVGRVTGVHPAAPINHEDVYALFARRTATGFDFTLTSEHVPEPATLLLLGTGLAGFAIRLRRRLKS